MLSATWSEVVVFGVLGLLLGAHPKIARVFGPVTIWILEAFWFLLTNSGAWVVSKLQRKPKQELDPAAPAASESTPAATTAPESLSAATAAAESQAVAPPANDSAGSI